jgi:hypothetical protein
MTDEPVGANCVFGGVKIETGLDIDDDSKLSESEVVTTKYVCRAEPGKNSLSKIFTESPGTNCGEGGLRIVIGMDSNSNNLLDVNEITQTEYLCNGMTGKNWLTTVLNEAAGINCGSGGYKMQVGLDLNSNSQLEQNEITETRYVCNGINAVSSLTVIADEPAGANCVLGGIVVKVGLDNNANFLLDNSEVQSTKYICAPQTGNDKQVRIEVGSPNFGTSSTDWTLSSYPSYNLIKFNKLDYSNVDSITFVPSLVAFGPDPLSPGTATVYAQLYNVTNSQPITGSDVSAVAPNYTFHESRNIYDHLPIGEKTYAIRVKSGITGHFVGVGYRSYLIIYKH